jgi:hypothetical protein
MKRLMPLLAFSTLVAQQPAGGTEEQRQFDFWLGSWEVRDRTGTLLGRNRVEALLGGRVLQEHWTGSKGGAGTSLNAYLPGKKVWRQTWVDSQGSVLDLEGGRVGASMVLASPAGAAGPAQRITWTPLPDGRVRQFWEQSSDGGLTWKAAFEGFYSRVP